MNDIILKADRVLVGEDLNLKEHMAVIVRDGKIEEIVPQAECPAVEGAEVIDLKNTTLMPGMIECHTIFLLTPRSRSIWSFWHGVQNVS